MFARHLETSQKTRAGRLTVGAIAPWCMLCVLLASVLLLGSGCKRHPDAKSDAKPSPSAPAPERAPLRIDAAASLRGVLGPIGQAFEKETGMPIKPQFAASGELAQQLLAAPRADVFISAASNWMDKLGDAKVIDPSTRRDLFGGILVLVAHRESRLTVDALTALPKLDVERIVIGEPKSVPAGRYAKELLEKVQTQEGKSLFSVLEKRFVTMPSVTAVGAQVATSHKVIGFVYASDAVDMTELKVLLRFPPPEGPKVVYPGAVLAQSKHPEARAFLDFLGKPESQKTLEQFGFVVDSAKP